MFVMRDVLLLPYQLKFFQVNSGFVDGSCKMDFRNISLGRYKE